MAIDEELAQLDKTPEDDLPPLRLTEAGYNGITVLGGQVFEECRWELRWPYCTRTYKNMLTDGTIAPAIDQVSMMISRVPWHVAAPKGYEEELSAEIAYVESVMKDMQHSWLEFIKQATSFVGFGFAPFEIVPRYRLKSKGSKYNDGFIGIKKLALRSQDTIVGWKFKNKGRDLSHIVQRVNIPQNKEGIYYDYGLTQDNGKTDVSIPMGRILLFRNNPVKDSPIGTSPLNSVWESWKYKKAYESSEAQGCAADLHGFKVLYIPPQYMSPTASAEDAAVYEHYKKIMRNVHIGKESGLILPQLIDSDSGEGYFKFEVVSVTGQKSFDVNQIIERYKREILTALYADFLVSGQNGGGSYALAESKLSLAQMVIESKLEEIRDVLNHYLIPRLFEWNGWETEVYPTFEYGEVADTTLAEFAKALQQASATGNVLKTPENINAIQEKLKLPARVKEDISQDELYKLLSDPSSKSGAGMSEGLSNGQGSSSGGSGDSSASNANNK